MWISRLKRRFLNNSDCDLETSALAISQAFCWTNLSSQIDENQIRCWFSRALFTHIFLIPINFNLSEFRGCITGYTKCKSLNGSAIPIFKFKWPFIRICMQDFLLLYSCSFILNISSDFRSFLIKLLANSCKYLIL